MSKKIACFIAGVIVGLVATAPIPAEKPIFTEDEQHILSCEYACYYSSALNYLALLMTEAAQKGYRDLPFLDLKVIEKSCDEHFGKRKGL